MLTYKKMNRKGSTWLAWILATMLFTTLAIGMILWAKARTTELAGSTAEYEEAKMRCNEIIIAAEKVDGCKEIEVENKGTLNIEKLVVRYNGDSFDSEEPLLVQKTITLKIDGTPNKVELLPIIKVDNVLGSCSIKKLTIDCP